MGAKAWCILVLILAYNVNVVCYICVEFDYITLH